MNKLTKKIVLPFFDFDLNMAIKPSSVLNYFQDIAIDHANKLKVGNKELSPNDLVWILSKVKVNFINDFIYNDEITLTTAPRAKNKIILERNYIIKNKTDKIIADGTSKWCLINKNTKKIMPLNLINYPINKNVTIPITNDIEIFSTNLNIDYVYSYIPKYSDLDFNGHVNNAKYGDFIFNAINLDELSNKKIKSFQINYHKECLPDQVLNFYRNKDNNIYIILGKNQENEIAVSAKIEFYEI